MRAERFGDFPVACGNWLCHPAPTGGEIAARFAFLWNTRQTKRYRLTVDHEHAFIAFANFRNVALRHHGHRAIDGLHFDDGIAIRVVCAYAKNRGAAHAVEFFHNHVLVQVDKNLQAQHVTCDHRRYRKLYELGDG